MHHKIISKKIFHSFTRYIKYRFTVSSPLFKFHNAKLAETRPILFATTFPNVESISFRIKCYFVFVSRFQIRAAPLILGHLTPVRLMHSLFLIWSTPRLVGKCARARANRSSTYFSPHSSIIHFQLYAWLPSRLFFARDTLDSSIRIPDRETWRVLRTARILSVLSTPFTFNPVIIISITISKIGKI